MSRYCSLININLSVSPEIARSWTFLNRSFFTRKVWRRKTIFKIAFSFFQTSSSPASLPLEPVRPAPPLPDDQTPPVAPPRPSETTPPPLPARNRNSVSNLESGKFESPPPLPPPRPVISSPLGPSPGYPPPAPPTKSKRQSSLEPMTKSKSGRRSPKRSKTGPLVSQTFTFWSTRPTPKIVFTISARRLLVRYITTHVPTLKNISKHFDPFGQPPG